MRNLLQTKSTLPEARTTVKGPDIVAMSPLGFDLRILVFTKLSGLGEVRFTKGSTVQCVKLLYPHKTEIYNSLRQLGN